MFVAIEGIDGSGKTTQVNLLKDLRVNDLETFITKEPTDGEIGFLIKRILRTSPKLDNVKMQLLFAADRSEHNSLLLDLKDKLIISDRYVLSSLAYGMASGIEYEWLASINSKFMMPDINIIIDFDPADSIGRLNTRDSLEAYENLEFLGNVRKAYKFLAEKYSNCIVLDGTKSIESLHEEILRIIKEHAIE